LFLHDGLAFVESDSFVDLLGCLRQEHMDHLVTELLARYHEERPHLSKDNAPLTGDTRNRKNDVTEVVPLSTIGCRQRPGGLLKHYYRMAA
jgi:hypothetical protein